MTTLKLEAPSHDPTRLNVIFVHGLGGNSKESWQTATDAAEIWIKWLAYDLRDVAVWTVDYDAAKSLRHNKSSMALADRALNILEHILATKELNGAEIAFVGHSTGGLVIKQVMRTAESLASSRADAERFHTQVRRIALMATPNLGTGQATFIDFFRIFTRPSAAAAELVRNSPGLRELNFWYREWATRNEILHLILVENKPTSWIWGLIATPDTSDPGLSSRPIPIDADHFSISKPISRTAEVYVLIKNFLSKTEFARHPDKAIKTVLAQHSGSLETIISGQSELSENVRASHELLIRISEKSEISTNPKLIVLIDSQINVRLGRLTKCRFFSEFERIAEANKLAEELLRGELAAGTPKIRSKALGWCSRILADVEHISQARSLLSSARSLGDCKETQVAEAFLLRVEGKYKDALKILSSERIPLFITAMFMIVQQEHGYVQALEWAEKSQIDFSDLDGDGKFIWLTCLLNTQQWDKAQNLAASVFDVDFVQAPILLYVVALSNLLLAVPDELRQDVDGQVPFELDTFPLNDDRNSLLLRKTAADLFSKASIEAENLGCKEFSKVAFDFYQWLLLRDRDSKESGLALLKKNLDSSDYSLRYVNFALKFGLKLDHEAVEKEINKQVAISGGASLDVAIARLALTLNQSSPASVLRYLAEHRAQLEDHIMPALLNSIEIQALVASGKVEQAEQLISELKNDGVSGTLLEKYQWFVETAAEDNTGFETRFRQYKQSGAISDLAVLVQFLLQDKDWERLSGYARDLFRLTNSIADAESLTIALENSGRLEELEKFLSENGELVEKSDLLMTSWSWALYRAGRLADASSVLNILISRRDDERDRSLEVNIAIASGAWESLAEFVEKQWKNRGKRTAVELMRAARIAQAVSAPRAKDLLFAAIEAAPTNPNILMNGYMLASESGWESDSVSSWMSTAAESSTDEGPIRRVSLEEIVKAQPDWDRRVTETSKKLLSGEIPIFLAARTLNRTLIALVLANGILNIGQRDPRRRTVISAFSGARIMASVSGGNVAMDATAILTIGRLGFLENLKATFSSISIPHSTLPLFFEESRKVAFHQPSQLKRANFVRKLLSLGEIEIAPETASANPDLIIEVGDELAGLLGEVAMQRAQGSLGSYVVTSFPVHRAGSLREEEVDLSGYESILCDAGSVLRKLVDTGQIMLAEQEFAHDYLQTQAQLACREVELPDAAILYFDDLTVIHMYHAGILQKLKSSELKVFVSAASVAHVDALIESEASAPEQLELIGLIKKYLENGIVKGDIKLSPAPKESGAADYEFISHPSLSVMQDTENKDCILVDDRYFNHHLLLEDQKGAKVPIITSLDLLETWKESELISMDQYCNAMTMLRRSVYIFVPIHLAELQQYFDRASVRDGVLLETAELKAIREYLLKIRMTDAVKVPQEGPWLESVLRTFMNAIKDQWSHNIEENVAGARSDWLWAQVKALHWATVLPEDGFFINVLQQFKLQNMSLVLAPTGENFKSVREKYWHWMEQKVVVELKDTYPGVYEEILMWCGKTVSEVVMKSNIADDKND